MSAISNIIIPIKTTFKTFGLLHGIRKIIITSIYKRLTDNVMADHVYAKSSFHFLRRFYKRHKVSFDFSRPQNDIKEDEFIVWTCWLQGMESAPDLVKACINSATPYVGGRRIIVITYDNLARYVSLPDFVLEKHQKGYIHPPLFTDILRTYLLYVYGGIWFDATVLFTQPVPPDLLAEKLFFFRSPLDDSCCPISSWFIIAAKRKNGLLYKLLCALLAYWQINDKYIDYFMFHYFLQAIIQDDPESADLFNKIPYRNNQNPHYVQLKLLFSAFDRELWEKAKNVSFCHKLTYKIPAAQKGQESPSFYSFISENANT